MENSEASADLPGSDGGYVMGDGHCLPPDHPSVPGPASVRNCCDHHPRQFRDFPFAPPCPPWNEGWGYNPYFNWGSPVPGYYRPRQHPGGFSGDVHCPRQQQQQPGLSDVHKDLVSNYGPAQVSVYYIQF